MNSAETRQARTHLFIQVRQRRGWTGVLHESAPREAKVGGTRGEKSGREWELMGTRGKAGERGAGVPEVKDEARSKKLRGSEGGVKSKPGLMGLEGVKGEGVGVKEG